MASVTVPVKFSVTVLSVIVLSILVPPAIVKVSVPTVTVSFAPTSPAIVSTELNPETCEST